MKVGDRVRARTDMDIVQCDGTVIDISGNDGDGGPRLVLVKWDKPIEGVVTREIPRAWVQEIPAVDRLADLA